jgi:hypothetical protein
MILTEYKFRLKLKWGVVRLIGRRKRFFLKKAKLMMLKLLKYLSSTFFSLDENNRISGAK